MFKDMFSNEEIKNFLVNELKNNKNRGAYIFYGEDEILLEDFAKAFFKSLTCKVVENDFCNKCDNCLRINNNTHGDLEIYQDENGVKIDIVRDMGYISSTTTYEGGNRIFIIKNAEKLKKEAGNALLKIIEEPEKGNFFILLSKNLNLLPTIKSRCTILKIKNRTAEELGVSKEEYIFFLGKGKDILEYKKYGLEIKTGYSYQNIYKSLEKYIKLKEIKELSEDEKREIIEEKIKIYKGLNDLYQNIDYIDVAERIGIGEQISYICGSNREIILEFLNYLCYFIKDFDKLEKIILLKNKIKSNVNVKLLLRIFMLEL